MGWDLFYKGSEGFCSGKMFCCILVYNNCYIMSYVAAKKKATCVQGSCAMHIIRWTLRHLSFSFCYHITHYVAKPFPL